MNNKKKAKKLLGDILTVMETTAAEIRGAEKMQEAAADELQTDIDILYNRASGTAPLQRIHFETEISKLKMFRDAIRALNPKKVLEGK